MPQLQRRDGEDAAAAAQVQHPLAAMNGLLQRRQAQPGGGVAAGAEGQAGIQHQRYPARPEPRPDLGILPQPLRHHQQPVPDLHGLVVLLPVVLPVGVLQIVQGHQQRAAVVPGLLQLLQGDADLPQLGEALVPRLQVEGDPGPALHLLPQILVHIVPVLMVVLQKVLKLRLVVDHHAVDPVGGEHRLHRLQSGVVCVDLYLQPFHGRHLISPPGRIILIFREKRPFEGALFPSKLTGGCPGRTGPACRGRSGCRSPAPRS